MREEIVYPSRRSNDPGLGREAVMVAMGKDLTMIRRLVGSPGKPIRTILTSRVYGGQETGQGIAVVGPICGAPYAVMVLEHLIVLGVRRILFFGWCGSIQQTLPLGGLLVPDRALSDEGTSAHYPAQAPYPKPSASVSKAIESSLAEASLPFHKGPLWSTDAPYRETREKVLFYRKQGVLGVDMELSALFTAACFRQVDLGALLVVSDELSSLTWKPGFSSKSLQKGRKMASEVIPMICEKLARARVSADL